MCTDAALIYCCTACHVLQALLDKISILQDAILAKDRDIMGLTFTVRNQEVQLLDNNNTIANLQLLSSVEHAQYLTNSLNTATTEVQNLRREKEEVSRQGFCSGLLLWVTVMGYCYGLLF